MKIQIASDLHFEFLQPHKYQRLMEQFKGEADVLVLAGDICPLRFVDQVRDTFGPFCEKYKHVVYVPGNHEYYKSDPDTAHRVLGAVGNELHNFYPLLNREIEIEGQKFYGGTLWFKDRSGQGKKLYLSLKELLNDFYQIGKFEPWVYEQNANFRTNYERLVTKDHIVISHHLPSEMSVPLRFQTQVPGAPSLNWFFVNSMDDGIAQKKPKLWVHGHTHDPCDYRIMETRVVCNPRGYPGEGSVNKFNDNFIIEV